MNIINMFWFLLVSIASANMVIEQYPSKEAVSVETIDRIPETGTYLRVLGNMSIDAGKYYIILTLEPEKFHSEIDLLYSKIDAFEHTYYESIHNTSWSDRSDILGLKLLIEKEVLSTLSQLRNKISVTSDKFTNLLFAYMAPKFERKLEKRGLFNFVGSALSYLFGTAQKSDVNDIKHDVVTTKKEILSIVHSNEKLVSVLSLKNHQIDDLVNVQDTILNATKYLTSSLLAQTRALSQLKRQSFYNQMTNELSTFNSKVMLSLTNLNLHISNYFEFVQEAKLGYLNPQLISPPLMFSILKNIQSNLPSYLSIPCDKNLTNLFELYSLLKTDLVTIDDKKQAIVIEIPLINKFRMFQIVLPTIFRMPLVEKVNATSVLELKSNQIYILSKEELLGYNIGFNDLMKNCNKWDFHFICHETLLKPLQASDVNCLINLLDTSSKNLQNCKKHIIPQNNVSQFSYLNRNLIGFSIRGNALVTISCPSSNDTFTTHNITLNGVGKFEIPKSCIITIEKNRFFSEYYRVQIFNHSLKPNLSLTKVTPGFLATNLQWENLENTTFERDTSNLKSLESSLLHEISFQTNRSLLNKKTKSLLAHTQKLLKTYESSLIDSLFSFELPAKYDVLNYIIIVTCIVAGITAYLLLKKQIIRQQKNLLKIIHRSYYPMSEHGNANTNKSV